MQKLQFDTHIGQYHSLAAIKTGYPLLKIMKIINLECHILCAIDNAINLHFIQYREKTALDPMIYPPKYALTNHPKIYFSLELLSILKEADGKPISEQGFLQFFTKLDCLWENDPEICLMKPGTFFFKPMKNGLVYFIDLSGVCTRPKIAQSFGKVNHISKWSNDMIMFSSVSLKAIFIYHNELNKIKKLKFSQADAKSLKAVPEYDLCVAIFNNTLEILNIKTNSIVERFIFDIFSENIITTSPKGSKILHTYLYGKILEGNLYIDIWDVTTPEKIKKRDPIRLDDSLANDHHVDFINEECFIHVERWTLNIFKITGSGIIKVYTATVPHNLGYIKSKKDGHCLWSHLHVFVPKIDHFLLLTTDVFEDGYNRIESYNVNRLNLVFDEEFEMKSNSLKKVAQCSIGSENKQSNHKLQRIRTNHKLKMAVEIQSKVLFEEKVDYIAAICAWKSLKVGILYESYQFYEYDLQSDKLHKRVVLGGISNSKELLKEIKYINQHHILFCFQKERTTKPHIIIVNLETCSVAIDSKELKRKKELKSIDCFVISGDQRVILTYKKYQNNSTFLGEVNLHTKDLIDLIKLDLNQAPSNLWSMHNKYIVGCCAQLSDTLFIWNLDTKSIEVEKKFCTINKANYELANSELCFWAVTDLNEQMLAFIATGMTSVSSAVIVYNWIEDKIIAKCDIDAEDILGVINDELFILLKESHSQICETFYATISLKNIYSTLSKRDLMYLDYQYFGKFFLGFEKSSFECLNNQKHVVLLIKQFFPQSIFIMRKRNKELELLRFLKKELENSYHQYLVQDVTKMITD